jgi:hypothetical protein
VVLTLSCRLSALDLKNRGQSTKQSSAPPFCSVRENLLK